MILLLPPVAGVDSVLTTPCSCYRSLLSQNLSNKDTAFRRNHSTIMSIGSVTFFGSQNNIIITVQLYHPDDYDTWTCMYLPRLFSPVIEMSSSKK